MRLKTFTAATMREIMAQVRAELGPDAIIVSTLKEDGRIRVTAAAEHPPVAHEPPAEEGGPLAEALAYHGVPAELAGRLAARASAETAPEPTLALAAAIDARYRFAPLSGHRPGRPLLLIGPPGSGKTTTAAKLAAAARLKGRPIALLTVDHSRAGALHQLDGYARVLGLELAAPETPAALRDALGGCDAEGAIVVDSPGVNPFDPEAVDRLADFAAAGRAEPVLVLPAGLDPLEAVEIAEAYAPLAPSRMVTTRIDMARRLGSVLAAAEAGRTAFADVGTSPRIADGLSPLTPVALARLLMRDPLRLDTAPEPDRPKQRTKQRKRPA